MTITETFEDQPIVLSRLEVLEEHKGEKWPADRPLVPNRVLVNGVGLWCPVDQPIVVQEFTVGERDNLVVVALRLQARALRIGDATMELPGPERVTRNRYVVVELPGQLTRPSGPDDEVREFPYAVVEGMKLALGGPVRVLATETGGDELVVVELPLVCRSVVFDDRSTDPVEDEQ